MISICRWRKLSESRIKKNSVNQIIKGTNIFEEGDEVTEIGLVVKGRVRVQAEGINLALGSGNFLDFVICRTSSIRSPMQQIRIR